MPRFLALLSGLLCLSVALSGCRSAGYAYTNVYEDSIRPELERANSPFLKHDHRKVAVTQSVYCYRTLGQPMCYHQQHRGQDDRLLGYFEVEGMPPGAQVMDAPPADPGPVIVRDTRPLAPQTAERPVILPPEPTPEK